LVSVTVGGESGGESRPHSQNRGNRNSPVFVTASNVAAALAAIGALGCLSPRARWNPTPTKVLVKAQRLFTANVDQTLL
jgi:hypothetical protein